MSQFNLGLVRESPAEAVPRSLHAAPDTVLVALVRRRGARAVLALAARLHLVDEVAGTAAANVVHGSLLGAETLLLLEFLVKAEHGAFLFAVHVACAAAARGEEGVGGRRSELDTGCWATGCGAVGEVVGLDTGYVAGTAAARVDVGATDGRVRLGDVEGDHFACLGWCC
jgi:hypothetical protein